MQARDLGRSGLEVPPLVFGGNVFGWTLDASRSFDMLDRLLDAGLNAIDTADIYSAWAPGNQGGESETVLGQWFAKRPSAREQVVLISKVGAEMGPHRKGLSEEWITRAVEDSLRRLQTDYLDLYMSHFPDPGTSFEETLAAYDKLLHAGKIRAIGASNLDATQLKASLETAVAKDLPRYDVLQPQYSLMERDDFEGDLEALCRDEDIGVISYFSLASGFLTGKYRASDDLEGAARSEFVRKYLTSHGFDVLDTLDDIADLHDARPAEVALAWLMAKPAVTAPIVSATSESQLDSMRRAIDLALTPDDIGRLDQASA